MTRVRRYLTWLYWAVSGPDFTQLNPGDPREWYDAAVDEWLQREPTR